MARLVRKQPLLDKIKAWPFDFFLWLNETRLSIEWDDYCNSLAVPLGSGLTLVYVILLKIIAYYSSDRRENKLFQTDIYTYERIKYSAINGENVPVARNNQLPGYWLSFVKVSALGIFLISLVNFVNVFLVLFKKYSLLNATNAPNSPSLINHHINNTNEENLVWSKVGQYLYDNTNEARLSVDYDDESFFDEDSLDEINLFEKNVFQLNVWNPSKFPLYFFTALSPVTLSVIKLSDYSMWKAIVTAILLSAVQYFIITQRFLILIHDKQILYQEMFSEYNEKFVKPKTSILKKDVVVDATYGASIPADFTVHQDRAAHLKSSNKLKVFITHDINGKPFNHINANKIKSRSATPHNLSRLVSRLVSPSHQNDTLRRVHLLEARLNEEKDRLRGQPSSMSVYDMRNDRSWRDERDWRDDSYRESSLVRTPYTDRTYSRRTPLSRSRAEPGSRSPSRLDRRYDKLDSVHKPDLSPDKFTPRHEAIARSSRTPSPSRDSPFRSPSPQRIHNSMTSPRVNTSVSSIHSRRSPESRRPFR